MKHPSNYTGPARAIARKVLELEGRLEELQVGALDGVEFASDEAAEAAIEADMTHADFVGRTPSGKTGFTVADVRAAQEGEGEGGEE